MPYDIFISYSSHDVLWAQKLEADLTAQSLKCFLDRSRLQKGAKWEPQLLAALKDSRHFLVLWSKKAHESDWVQQELYGFRDHIDPGFAGHPHPGHLLYAVNLEGQNATLASYQLYTDAAIQGAYQQFLSAPAALNLSAACEQTWKQWVIEIVAAANADTAPKELPVGILALTTNLLQTAPPEIPDFDFVTDPNLSTFLRRVGVQAGRLDGRYGATPFHWRPAGKTGSVIAMLSNLRLEINGKLATMNKPPVRFALMDLVSPPLNTLIEVAKPLLSGPCLIIIDPVSLFSSRIYNRYVELAPCFWNPQAAIVFLAPFGKIPPLTYLRQCLTERGKSNLKWFHDPIPFNPDYANCGINIADEWDIRRLVLASLGRERSTKRSGAGDNILN